MSVSAHKRLEKLDGQYADLVGMISDLISRAASISAERDQLLMTINEQEAGLLQRPRPVSFWRSQLLEALQNEPA